MLGLSRECFFYIELAPVLSAQGVDLAVALFQYGDLSSGAKTLVLEDLSAECVQAGYLFGACFPHNWGKDLEALITANNTQQHVVPTIRQVTSEAFRAAARMHARYWMDRRLLDTDRSWLRGAAYFSSRRAQT